jgi:hypothetical protein
MIDCVPGLSAGFRTAKKKVEHCDFSSNALLEKNDFVVLLEFWNKKPARCECPARGNLRKYFGWQQARPKRAKQPCGFQVCSSGID